MYTSNFRLNSGFISDERVPKEYREQAIESIPDYFYHKGSGFIAVDNPEKALTLLKEYVGEYEFDYCPTNFICTIEKAVIEYWGKFDLENPREFIKILLDAGVKVTGYCFEDSNNPCL